MNKDTSSIQNSLPDPPENITLVDKGATWSVIVTTANEAMVKLVRGGLLIGGFVFIAILSNSLDPIMEGRTQWEVIGVLLLVVIFLGFWYVLIKELWLVTSGYHQHIRLVLYPDKFLIRQTAFLSWREDCVLYTKEELEKIRVESIEVLLKKNRPSSKQTGLQIKTKIEGVSPFLWGACLKEKQLVYMKQLLQSIYMEEQMPAIFAPPKDLSKHLLEE
ncbi:MAG: hypothetical protein ACRBFS_25815 [Aureispira sp.]